MLFVSVAAPAPVKAVLGGIDLPLNPGRRPADAAG